MRDVCLQACESHVALCGTHSDLGIIAFITIWHLPCITSPEITMDLLSMQSYPGQSNGRIRGLHRRDNGIIIMQQNSRCGDEGPGLLASFRGHGGACLRYYGLHCVVKYSSSSCAFKNASCILLGLVCLLL